MTTPHFVALYVAGSLFWKWILSWGGARQLEGWKAFWLLGWAALDWKAEQIRFYALLMWGISTVAFIIGLINPQYRF